MSPGSCILPCVHAYGSTLGPVLYKVLTLWGKAALDFLQHRTGRGGNQATIVSVLVEATSSAQHEIQETSNVTPGQPLLPSTRCPWHNTKLYPWESRPAFQDIPVQSRTPPAPTLSCHWSHSQSCTTGAQNATREAGISPALLYPSTCEL